MGEREREKGVLVNFSRGGVVCKAWSASGTPGDDSESPHRRGIRGATHFKQTFHPRVFLLSASHSVPFISRRPWQELVYSTL